jgi:uncharacterized protein DUF3631
MTDASTCRCGRAIQDDRFCSECGFAASTCECELAGPPDYTPTDPNDLQAVVWCFENCDTIDAIAALMKSTNPPTTEVQRVALRGKLLKVLKDNQIPTPAKLVDAWYADSSQLGSDSSKGTPVTFDDPEPWPEVVNGAEVLDEVVSWIKRYVTASPSDVDTVALYAAFTHAYDLFDICPHLFLTSPTKRCGKTTLMRLIERLVPRPLMASNISTASVYRVVEDHRPVLLIDEADTFVAQSDELRGILNSGHTRESAFVIRQVGTEKDDSRKFSVWTPKVVAAIGHLWDTFEDRAIIVHLKRRGRDERVERVRSRAIKAEGASLHSRLARWVADSQYEVATFEADLPHLHERAEDNWLGLFAIAAAAGGDWPARAMRASKNIASEGDEATIGEQLVIALRRLFDSQPDTGFLPSHALIDGLAEIEGGPWELMWSKDLVEAARSNEDAVRSRIYSRLGTRVSRDLKPFAIPKTVTDRIDGEVTRGYRREWFEPLWVAYAPELQKGVSAVTGVTALPAASQAATGETATDAFQGSFFVADQGTLNRRYETGSTT